MKPEPTPAQLDWTTDQFTTGPNLDQPCPEVIDITGRMRVLVFGPMAPLEAGQWRLEARFGLNASAARYPYILQFIHGESVAEVQVQPSAAGEYVLTLETGYPHRALTALRLWLAQAAFDGELYFHGASIRPAGSDD